MENLIDADVSNEELPDDNDLLDKTENLTKIVHQLKSEKKKLEADFNSQRAKMKDLFIQKEDELKRHLVDQDNLKSEIKRLETELSDTKSQLTVAKLDFQSKLEDQKKKSSEELSSLQQIISETLEELNKNEREMKRLHVINEKLSAEINDLKARFNNGTVNVQQNFHGASNSTGADMPPLLAVPGTVISTIARTVKSQISTQLANIDPTNSSSNSNNNNLHNYSALAQPDTIDTLDESMRKAQEDAEVLRSVVVPLEEEIEALKDKLRLMDSELNSYRRKKNAFSKDNVNILPESENDGCCRNEVSSQQNVIPTNQTTELKDINESNSDAHSIDSNRIAACTNCPSYETQLINAQQKINDLEKHIIGLERYKQELNKETAFRKQMEETWNDKKEKYKEQVTELQSKIKKSEETLRELHTTFTNTSLEFAQELERLRRERERVEIELNRLEEENNYLSGKYSKHSEQLQREPINLPNTVEELQEIILNHQQELIITKVSKEKFEDQITLLKCEMEDLKNQIRLLNDIMEEVNKLQSEIYLMLDISQAKEGAETVSLASLRLLRSHLNSIVHNKREMKETIGELRSRVSSLQTELNNSEKVQKDFVTLSQSLQQELERIRTVDSQVRWEHDEDINKCPRCKTAFIASKKKQHCRHCGRIFCSSCLSHTVHSGPNNRASQVCDVCHTLLVRNTAPYFSTSVVSHSN